MIVKEEKSDSSKKQSKRHNKKRMANTKEKKSCPLCLDTLELDDLYFFPCVCEYQVCRFCWHQIKVNENSSCPACRRQYSDDPANYKPLSAEEIQKMKAEKKLKEKQKKKEVQENRNQQANKRILQKNLVYIQGLPSGIESDNKKLISILQLYGPLHRCIVNNKTNYAGSQTQRATAYVTYQKVEDALRACKSIPHHTLDGHNIKASLGTTKYCSMYLKNTICTKKDCMYLHETADEELCFTKEQIQASEHVKYAEILYERLIAGSTSQKNTKNSPPKETVFEVKQASNQPTCSSPDSIDAKEEFTFVLEENVSPPPPPPPVSKFQQLFSNNSEQQSLTPGSEAKIQKSSSSSSFDLETFCEWVPNGLSLDDVGGHSRRENSGSSSSCNSEEHYKMSLNRETEVLFPQNKSFPLQNGFLDSYKKGLLSILDTSIREKSNSLSNSFMSRYKPEDDDLDFDPTQLSLENLKAMVDQEQQTSPLANGGVKRTTFPPSQLPTLLQQKLKLAEALRPRNPPPGFNSGGDFLQQSHTPLYEMRNNALPSRVSSIFPTSQSPFSSNRSTLRFQNFSPLGSNFPTQPVHSLNPQLFQNLMSQSTPNIQLIQSQRCDNLPVPQFSGMEPQNLSHSQWSNMNHHHWMQQENYQNQTLPDLRPASPLLNHFNRLQSLKVSDTSRQLQQLQQQQQQQQQLAARYSSSPFMDNSQMLFPTQLSQVSKGVHTFP